MRRPNPYRVLAHALDAGDARLVDLLTARLGVPRPASVGPASVAAASPAGPAPAAEAAIERLLALLAPSRAPG